MTANNSNGRYDSTSSSSSSSSYRSFSRSFMVFSISFGFDKNKKYEGQK